MNLFFVAYTQSLNLGKSLLEKVQELNGSSADNQFIAETYEGIMNLKYVSFCNMKSVSRLHVSLLKSLQHKLPNYLEMYFIETVDKSNKKLDSNQLTTPICKVPLPFFYKALINKFDHIPGLPKKLTVQDILDFDLYEFGKLKTVGARYVTLLKRLKKELPIYVGLRQIPNNYNIESKLPEALDDLKKTENIDIDLIPQDVISKLKINYSFLDTKELKLLSKLARHFEANNEVDNILYIINLNENLLKDSGFGAVSLTALNKLKKRISEELKILSEKNDLIDVRKQGLFIYSKIQFLEMKEIDNILIEDIENYLWTLDDMKMDIAISQWGFNHPYITLEKLAETYNVTRQRIQQFTIDLNDNLLKRLRLHPKVLWANIQEHMTSGLESLLPNFRKCFSTKNLFFSFIEFFCQVPKESIKEIVCPEFNKNILGEFFSKTPSPVSYEEIISELISNFGYSKAQAENIVRSLEKIEKIKIVDKGILPRNLSQKTAIEHILATHPLGLPWKDVSKIVNMQRFSSTKISENRINLAFNSSDLVYLCAHGNYRHVMFLNIENIDIKNALKNIIIYLELNRLQNIHLHDYFYQKQKDCFIKDYFTLRHIVRSFGEEYGLYFDGKSGVDSVSLKKNDERVTQLKVIVRTLEKADGAMTKQEIAEILRSKSNTHAAYYLNNLLKDGKVVRIDRMMYTIPEKAFKNVNKIEILEVVKNIMESSELPVDADIFRERINLELNLSYSKYFYTALVKTELKNRKWYNKYTLFSTRPIPFNSLYDISRQYCDLSLSNEDNIKIIQKFVETTKTSALKLINNLKIQTSISS